MLEYESVSKCSNGEVKLIQNSVQKFAKSLQNAKDADKEAFLKAEELKNQHTSTEKYATKLFRST